MLDIKFIRENPEIVKENIRNIYGSENKAWTPECGGLADVVLPVRPYCASYDGE